MADTHLRPWCVAARGKWGGRVTGAPGSCRSTVRWNERNGMKTGRRAAARHTQGARDQCVAGRTGRLRRQRSRAAAAVQRVAATQTHPHGSKAALRRDACGCDAVPATLKQRRRCGDSKLGKLV